MDYMYPDYVLKHKEVEKLVFPDGVPEYSGGCVRFESLDISTLKKIVQMAGEDLIEEAHNNSPTIGEILEKHEEDPRVRVFGYLVEQRRSDCRITVDGVLLPEEYPVDLDYARSCDEIAEEQAADGTRYRSYWWD